MSQIASDPRAGYWVIGGRWVDEERHLLWPRVVGPFADYQAARQSAEGLNAASAPDIHYRVAADVPERTRA